MRLWGERYLTKHAVGSTQVTVDVTPNGRGDAPTTVGESHSPIRPERPERSGSRPLGAERAARVLLCRSRHGVHTGNLPCERCPSPAAPSPHGTPELI